MVGISSVGFSYSPIHFLCIYRSLDSIHIRCLCEVIWNGCMHIKCKPKYVVFQFCYFSLFETHYHTLAYLQTRENKIWILEKIEPQHIMYGAVKWNLYPDKF